jgi:hypothetical protein
MLIRPLLVTAALVAALTFSSSAVAAPKPAFVLKYAWSEGHFTKISATAPVKATVKRPHQPAQATTLKALIGSKLPVGTKIKVWRGKAALSLKITVNGVR